MHNILDAFFAEESLAFRCRMRFLNQQMTAVSVRLDSGSHCMPGDGGSELSCIRCPHGVTSVVGQLDFGGTTDDLPPDLETGQPESSRVWSQST